MTGYSGTPLSKKLGFREGLKVYIRNTPDNYKTLLKPIPIGVVFAKRLSNELDLIHLFIKSRQELLTLLVSYVSRIKNNGMIWVSWPKKSSGVSTDVNEAVIREVALPLGLVDIKVCAIDEIWSGIKLVIRKEHRT